MALDRIGFGVNIGGRSTPEVTDMARTIVRRVKKKSGRPSGKKAQRKQAAAAPPKAARLTSAQRAAMDAAALAQDDEIVDASHVIVDFDELRERAIEAMGVYAAELRGDELVADIRRRKIGANHIQRVHPMDLDVLTGPDRINPRDFTSPEMRRRVAEMAMSVAAAGVHKPMTVFINQNKLSVIGGETRLRAVFHAWIAKPSSAPRTVPVLIDTGNNDADRALQVGLDNDQRPLTPYEVAQTYKRALTLGREVDEIAKRVGRTENHVRSMISMLEMPEAVLKYVQDGVVRITLAKRWWDEANHNVADTVARIASAQKVMKTTGATHVMPKHDVVAKGASAPAQVPAATTTTTTIDDDPVGVDQTEDQGEPDGVVVDEGAQTGSQDQGDQSGGESEDQGSKQPENNLPPAADTSRSATATQAATPASGRSRRSSAADGQMLETLDRIATAFADAEIVCDGEGFVLIKMTAEAYLTFAERISAEIPEDVRSLAEAA